VEAKVYYQRALAIQEQLAPDSPQVADYLNNLGILAHDQGNLVEARDYYQRARAVLEERVPVSLNLASNLTNLGALAHDQGKLGEAKDYYQRARAVLEQISPDSLGVATSLNNLGVVAYEQGGLEEAIRCYRQGLRLAQDRGGREETVANSGGLGRTLAAQGDLPGADEAYLLCLDTLEGWREVAGREAEEQAGLFSRFSSPFPEYAALLLKRDHPGEAFQVSERGKGRALLDVLAVGRTPLLERDLTAEERQEYAQREQKYYQLNQQVLQKQQENDDARLKELRPQRDEARFQLANYEQRLYTLHPGLQAQVGEVKPLTADAARRLPLPPDTLVLSYLVGEKQTLLFALRRTNPKKPGELAVHVLDLEAEALDDEVNSLRASLLPQTATGDASQVGFYTRRARKVGETLLKPVQKWLKKAKHLIVCSDQSLYDLPFGALIAPGQKEPLLTTHAVSLAPSVTVLGEWLKAVPKAAEPPRLLALGNPALPPPAKPEETGEVKIASARQLIDWGGGWRGEFRRTPEGDLVALPFAAEEVQELAGLYGERATVQVGEKA
jgi:Tfp pilus assembly protein PilF